MDAKTEYFEQTKALKDTDLTRVRGVSGVEWAVKLFQRSPRRPDSCGKVRHLYTAWPRRRDADRRSAKMLLGSWQRLQEPDSIVIDNAGYILLFPGEPLNSTANWR